jgi:tetratricopeptide (TPR) repeat protein
MQDYTKAIDLLQQSAELDTNKVKQYFYLGQSYQNIGKLSKAIGWYNKIIAIPGNEYLEKALWNKSQIQLKQGQNKEAIENLKQTRALNGSYAVPAQNLIDSLKEK